jgi:hypothetical protein
LLDACRSQGILPVRMIGDASADPATAADTGWLTVRLTDDSGALLALIDDPTLTVLVRPDRVIAAVTNHSRVPRVPWAA